MHPVDVDGRRLVILRHTDRHRFAVVTAGWISFDGEMLTMDDDRGNKRMISDEELAGFQLVIPANKIRECSGFDFFLLIP